MILKVIKWIMLIRFWNIENMVAGSTNIALNKPTRQINVYDYRLSSLAVDGNVANLYEDCAHTLNTTADAPNWWMVDLQTNYEITSVNVLNRGDCCAERLSNFTVSVWQYDPGPHIKHNMNENEFCVCVKHPQTVPQNEWANLDCSRTCIGRFVLLVSNIYDYFAVCEVQVFGNLFTGCLAQHLPEKYIRKIEGKRASPPNGLLSPFQVLDEYECSHKCLQMNNCVSFNYNPGNVNCQLVTCFSHPGQDMVADSNWNWRYISR